MVNPRVGKPGHEDFADVMGTGKCAVFAWGCYLWEERSLLGFNKVLLTRRYLCLVTGPGCVMTHLCVFWLVTKF